KENHMPAYDQLMQKAEELRAVHPKLSVAQAFSKIFTDPAHRELVDAERTQRQGSVHKDAAERLADRVAVLRSSTNITVEDAIARVRKRNPELIEAWRKSRNAVDPVGDELDGPDQTYADQNWQPSGSTPRSAIDPSDGTGYGDKDQMLMQLYDAWCKK